MGESGVIKSVVIFLLLAVFSLVAGSMVADSAKEAIIPALLVAGIAALIYLGKNCWWLIFIAPPVISAFGFMPGMPVAYGFCGIILLYWILMTCLGYTRMTWNGVKGLDIITLILMLYFLSTWVRHPVTINSFTTIYDEGDPNVGGQAYICCLGAIVFYVTLSVIPLKYEAVIKILKISFWVGLGIAVLIACKSVFSPSPHFSSAIELGDEDLRYSPFLLSGQKMIHYVFARYTLIGIMLSPWKIIALLLSFWAIAKSGFRSYILAQMIYIAVTSFFHRKLLFACFSICFGWLAVVTLSHNHIFDDSPFAVQRTLSAVPGIKLADKEAIDNAQASLEWRYELWELGWNPKYGYIKDYIWGDGFALSLSSLKKQNLLFSRGDIASGDFDVFAHNGGWHNGSLLVVHRTGYIGLVLLCIWFFVLILISLRVCYNARMQIGREYVYIYVLQIIPDVVLFFASAGTWEGVFISFFYTATITKVLYFLYVQQNIMSPMFVRKIYVPLMHQFEKR